MWRASVAALVVLVVRSAGAEPDRERTKAAITDYFDGEQRGGFVLVGMGAAGLLAGGLLVRSSNLTARGAAYPLLGIDVLHVAAGIFIYVSSARRVDTFTDQIATDPGAFVAGLTLGFDVFAASRAQRCRDELAAVDVQASIDSTGAPIALITHTVSF